MKADNRAKLRALVEGATRAPWGVSHGDDHSCMNVYGVTTKDADVDFSVIDAGEVVCLTLVQDPLIACHRDERWEENAAFIAAARDAVPALLDEVEDLECRLATVGRAADHEKTLRCQRDVAIMQATSAVGIRFEAPEVSLQKMADELLALRAEAQASVPIADLDDALRQIGAMLEGEGAQAIRTVRDLLATLKAHPRGSIVPVVHEPELPMPGRIGETIFASGTVAGKTTDGLVTISGFADDNDPIFEPGDGLWPPIGASESDVEAAMETLGLPQWSRNLIRGGQRVRFETSPSQVMVPGKTYTFAGRKESTDG